METNGFHSGCRKVYADRVPYFGGRMGMGKASCGPKAMDKVETFICNEPKLTLVTPSMVEKRIRLDHRQAAACLDSFTPHAGQPSTFELCEETGQGRWLIKSAVNPNQYWIDDPDKCMISAIRTADASGMPYPKNKELAAGLFVQCTSQQKLRNGRVLRAVGFVAGTALAVDGARRIIAGQGVGSAEFALGLLIDIAFALA